MKVEEAMKVLKDAGYYVENLWCIHDVDDDRLTNENKLKVLHSAIHRENIYSMINENIADELLILNESKMKTAVEWLYEELKENNLHTFNEWKKIFEQAKQMEKEQIIEAYMKAKLECIDTFGLNVMKHKIINDSEQYYNETFKS